MDAVKAVFYLLFANVSFNIILGMLPYMGVTPPYSGNVTIHDPNPGGLVDSWAGGDQPFYDIGTGLYTVWSTINMLVEGLPNMLVAFGVPWWITEPIYWYYRLLWVIAIGIGIIAGRQT